MEGRKEGEAEKADIGFRMHATACQGCPQISSARVGVSVMAAGAGHRCPPPLSANIALFMKPGLMNDGDHLCCGVAKGPLTAGGKG